MNLTHPQKVRLARSLLTRTERKRGGRNIFSSRAWMLRKEKRTGAKGGTYAFRGEQKRIALAKKPSIIERVKGAFTNKPQGNRVHQRQMKGV